MHAYSRQHCKVNVCADQGVRARVCCCCCCCRATPLDIFNFFDSYDIIAESLQLGVDALGRPSGEAWLTFASSDEALRAVRERNRHYLGNRYLELSLT
jgi:hypothetical protein